jgi:hypothetical protein
VYRAVHLCSPVDDFDDERRHVEMKLLLNGYPLQFVTYHVRIFFKDHDELMSMLEQTNQINYQGLRAKLLGKLSHREHRSNDSMIMPDVDGCREHHSNDQSENRNMIRVPSSFDSGLIMKLSNELKFLWNKNYL